MPVIKNRGLLKNKLQSKKAMNSTSKQRKYEQNTPIEESTTTSTISATQNTISINDISSTDTHGRIPLIKFLGKRSLLKKSSSTSSSVVNQNINNISSSKPIKEGNAAM